MIERTFGILLILSLLLQASVTILPICLILLILLYCYFRAEWIFIAAFTSGILLDIFQVRPVGISSIFFLIVLFLVFIYQRKFEIASSYFVFFAVFFGCNAYFFFFEQYTDIVTALFLGILASGSFWLLKQLVPEKKLATTLRWG